VEVEVGMHDREPENVCVGVRVGGVAVGLEVNDRRRDLLGLEESDDVHVQLSERLTEWLALRV